MDVQFNIGARKVADDLTEVELKITATSNLSQGAAYIVDLSYCGLVGMRNMGEEQQHALIHAEALRILFCPPRRFRCCARCRICPADARSHRFQGLCSSFQQKRAQEEAAGGMAPAPASADLNDRADGLAMSLKNVSERSAGWTMVSRVAGMARDDIQPRPARMMSRMPGFRL
jgi:preprotein translocase subunit SecB